MQVEEYDGPDFIYIDEEGHTASSDVIGKHNERTSIVDRGEITVDPDAELIATRQLYLSITAMNPDMRWGVARIQDEMREFLTEQADSTGGDDGQEGEAEVVPDDVDDTLADAPNGETPSDPSEPESPTEPGVLVPDIPPPDSPEDT